MSATQIFIFVTGAAGAALLAAGGRDCEALGYVILLTGQPAWLLETSREKQFGMLALAVFYTMAYAAGLLRRIAMEGNP